MQLSAPDMERAVAAEERRAYLLPLCRYHLSAWLIELPLHSTSCTWTTWPEAACIPGLLHLCKAT